MNKFISIVVASAVAVTSGVTTFVPAQAMPRIAPAAVQDGSGAEIQQVARRHRWQRQRSRARHGNRHHVRRYSRSRHYVHRRSRHHNYYPRYSSHHHDHYYRDNDIGIGVTLGIVGLAAGAIVGSGYHGGLSWQEACARKYRSFNWNTGMYMGYDGYWHRCVLP